MHQIQKLEMLGFKSFCDRTQIVFNEGITAIVGPNGCGKSNIADAISWVVGEQSAKTLRTDRMEGVIFNGTQARKATSLSEVVLTLTLMEHFSVPEGLDLNPEGFRVGRRLYRSGESEYYLDGKRCRLKDIQALFEGTGLGPNSYALIEQGRIGQILSSKPADRRALIEEAARITLFKSRRYSAEIKLEMAQRNLLRVNDIIREVVRQLNSLRRQAAKARRYNRLREELRRIQRLKFGMEERQLLVRLDDCSARFSAAHEREREILSGLARAEEDRSAGQEACRRQEELVDEARENLSRLKFDAGNQQSLMQNQEVQRLNLIERSKELDREQYGIEERLQIVGREQERLTNSLRILSEEIGREQEALDAEQSRSEILQEAIRHTEGEIDKLRSFLINGAGRLSDLRNLQARCQENIRRIDAQTHRLEGERESKGRERAAQLSALEDARQRAGAIATRQKEVAELHERYEHKSDDLVARIERVSTDLTARQEEYSLMQQRSSSLEEVERRRSNYSEGVQKFLSTRIPGEDAPPAQTLADQVETDPAYEAAIENYLNDPLQYILVEGMNDAVQNVERLKRIGAGKCTFMTLRNGHTDGHGRPRATLSGDGIVGYIDDLLRMREEVRNAFERALPDYASTVMVSDLDTVFRVAESYPGTNFLTLSGEAYSPRGTLSAVGERKSMAGFLALKREKRELEAKLPTLRGRIQATREELARLKEEQAAVVESLKTLTTESRKLEIEAVVAKHEISRLEEEIRKIDQTENVATLELSQLLAEKQDLEAQGAEAAAGIAEIEERSRSGGEELRELSARLESLKTESTALSKNLAVLISAHAVKQERKSAMETESRRLAGESEETRRRMEANKAEKAGTLTRIAGLEQAQQQTKLQIERCARLIEETEAALTVKHKELAARREALSALEEQLKKLHSEREEAMEVRGKIEIEKTRLESDIEHLERNCMEEFRLPLPEVTAGIEESEWQRDYQEVAQTHDQLKDRIENFGAINMRALEEYQENDERYQFLNSQRQDIEQSIADTQKAIAEINRRSIEQFQDAFKAIRENFMEVFQILFKGGQCDLRLLDDGDLLESGIDIIAQPPGKRLQNVLLLSGGEKALTALALLIAIFRYRPSPFCVLDEVDAPLDDANINRFTQLILELSKDTQFIIITHNKQTMEICQTLYGVTMEEPGISKIVGVEFKRQQQPMAS